jgi:hypothetical protein
VTRISSRKYLAGSRGQPCTLRIPGVCTGNTETTVPAHIRDRHTGRGQKASDISVCDACAACHAKFDGQAGEPLPRADWLFYALRGLQETLEGRIAAGLLFLSQDVVKPFAERTTKPRKPPSERTKIPHNTARKIQSRNNLRKATQ